MTVLTDIKRMQVEGRTESEIISALKQQGISPREITEAVSQSKIREAVAGESPYENPQDQMVPSQGQYPPAAAPATEQYPQAYPPQQEGEMTPSVAAAQQSQEAYPQQQAQYPQQQYEQQQPQYPQQYQQPQYEQQYQPYPQQPQMGAISPDTITEISEQVVAEKISPLRKDIEKVIDMKTTMDAKMEYLDERLKRIEKIIDRLQLSIMQKVGEYITNIDDIKKEIVETQKSFKSMANSQSSSGSREAKEERAEKPKKSREEIP